MMVITKYFVLYKLYLPQRIEMSFRAGFEILEIDSTPVEFTSPLTDPESTQYQAMVTIVDGMVSPGNF